MERILLVCYINVLGIDEHRLAEYVHEVGNKIKPKEFEGDMIVIPTVSGETKVECINPKYITDVELIEEHTKMIKKLQEQLKIQAELLNNIINE